MTIAVLMSVYKNEKADRLERCIKSIWDDQTLKPDQVILVEDGPLSDELYQVISTWQCKLKDKMDVLKNEVNLGLTKSLNKGISFVKTELIARMDTDDQSTPIRFEVQERYLKEHPEIDVLGGACNVINEKGESLYTQYFKKTHSEMIKQICWRCPLPHPTVMMRTKMFTEKRLKYDERFRNSQDIALWEDRGVYSRRGKVRAKNEYKSFSRAARLLYGRYSWRRILPILRYSFRCLPVGLISYIYQSSFFKKVFSRKNN